MKKMKKLLALILASILLLVVLAACGSTGNEDPSEPITIVFSTHNNEQDINVQQILKPYFAKLEELSDGLVTVEMHYNAELVGPADALEAVENGIVDAVFVRASTAGFEYDSIVEMGWPSLNTDHMSRIYNELYDKYPEMQANYKNVQPLLLYTMSRCFMSTTGKEIRMPEDVAGMNLIVNNALQGEWITSLGATPVSSKPTEFYTNLEKHIADGSPAPLTSIMLSDSWYEVCPYNLDICTSITTASIVMNKDVFNKLPAACQEYILNSRMEWADKIDEIFVKDDVEGKALMSSTYGTIFVTPTAEELAAWDAVSADLLPNYAAKMDAKGEPGTAFLNDYRALVEKYSD